MRDIPGLATQMTYIGARGVFCPACREKDMNSHEEMTMTSDGRIEHKVGCSNCLSYWTNYYTLSGYGDFTLGHKHAVEQPEEEKA